MTRGTACDKGVRMCRKALLAQSRVTTVGTRTWQRLSRDGWTHVGPSVCPLTTCGRAARSLQSRLPNLTCPFQTGGSDGTRHPLHQRSESPPRGVQSGPGVAGWAASLLTARAGMGTLWHAGSSLFGQRGVLGGGCAWSLCLVLEGPPGPPGPGRRPGRVDVASGH